MLETNATVARRAEVEIRTTCRSCGSSSLHPVASFGEMPLSDALLRPEEVGGPEPRYPLDLVLCDGCGLVQITATVAPERLFGEDYPYYSSVSSSWVEHARRLARTLVEERGLGPGSLVLEVASNDGYLLRHYVEADVPVLGIDPVPGPAEAARRGGVPTREAFFTEELARRLAGEGVRADVVHAHNVLAHVAELDGFVRGLATVLAPDGVIVVEVPYLRDLVERVEFDTIYHEHLCYFSLSALVPLVRRHGLEVVRVERIPTHGGSLRLRITKGGDPDGSVAALLAEEDEVGVTTRAWLEDFAARVDGLLGRLDALVSTLEEDGATIAAYGAAAKGAMLLNASGLGRDRIAYVVDRNEHKQGLHMPGVHLPIHDPALLLEDRPDVVLLLPWNLAEEILGQQAEYRAGGGRFLVPIPAPRLV